MRYSIPLTEIQRFILKLLPTQERMESLAFFAKQQVMDRHKTQGASGGEPWKIKRLKEWGYDDGRAILTGKSAEMLMRWFSYAEVDGAIGYAVVANSAPYAHVHELGTIGKGGVLPDIVPRVAKVLFIPITDRAISVGQAMGNPIARMSRGIGGIKFNIPEKHPNGPKISGVVSSNLVRGRLKNGKLQKWDDVMGEYVDGIPDFIFLTRVSIAPRPQLPTSQIEREQQQQFLIHETLG